LRSIPFRIEHDISPVVTPDQVRSDECGTAQMALSYIISLCQPVFRLFDFVDIRVSA
jgi:hypothetical protein